MKHFVLIQSQCIVFAILIFVSISSFSEKLQHFSLKPTQRLKNIFPISGKKFKFRKFLDCKHDLISEKRLGLCLLTSLYILLLRIICIKNTRFSLSFCQAQLVSGLLTNELQLARYELRITIYCTSYELLFIYELQVTIYCTSYEYVFPYKLGLQFIARVASYFSYTSYKLPFISRVMSYFVHTSYKLSFFARVTNNF